MENEFEMKDLGNLAYFLKLEFVNTMFGVFLHRKKYEKKHIEEGHKFDKLVDATMYK